MTWTCDRHGRRVEDFASCPDCVRSEVKSAEARGAKRRCRWSEAGIRLSRGSTRLVRWLLFVAVAAVSILWTGLGWLALLIPRLLAAKVRSLREEASKARSQREYWASQRCNRCHGHMPLERAKRNLAFCSEECATADRRSRQPPPECYHDYDTEYWVDSMGDMNVSGTCRKCGKTFSRLD